MSLIQKNTQTKCFFPSKKCHKIAQNSEKKLLTEETKFYTI